MVLALDLVEDAAGVVVVVVVLGVVVVVELESDDAASDVEEDALFVVEVEVDELVAGDVDDFDVVAAEAAFVVAAVFVSDATSKPSPAAATAAVTPVAAVRWRTRVSARSVRARAEDAGISQRSLDVPFSGPFVGSVAIPTT